MSAGIARKKKKKTARRRARIARRIARGGWYSRPEAADYYDVSEKTMDGWRVRGVGPRYVKLGGRVFYRQEDLDAHIEASLRTSTSTEARQLPIS